MSRITVPGLRLDFNNLFLEQLGSASGVIVYEMTNDSMTDMVTFEVSLTPAHGFVCVPGEELAGEPRGIDDRIISVLRSTKAGLRGAALRDWLQDDDGIDWMGEISNEMIVREHGNLARPDTEHERAERIGSQLIEIGESLIRRAQRTR